MPLFHTNALTAVKEFGGCRQSSRRLSHIFLQMDPVKWLCQWATHKRFKSIWAAGKRTISEVFIFCKELLYDLVWWRDKLSAAGVWVQVKIYWSRLHLLVTNAKNETLKTSQYIEMQEWITQQSLVKKRFQLILQVTNHNLTKNLTGHRMHVKGPQIYQMNRQINSLQNMCDML